MSDDDYFLLVCEKLWSSSEEGNALMTRAAQLKAGDENATGEIADAIDRNHVEQRLLLLRAHEMAVWVRRTKKPPRRNGTAKGLSLLPEWLVHLFGQVVN